MDLKKILEDIGLCDFFPGKLNRQSLFALADCNLTEANSPLKDLFSKFVNDLLHFDSNCRFIQHEITQPKHFGFRSRIKNPPSTEISTQTVHPLDLSTLLFLSCDQVAKQDLVCRFFSCKHAFPFIVQLGHLTSPKLYTWPIRGIVAKFDENGLAERLEQAISNIEFKIVSTLRFSECDISKSSIMNFVINRSSKGSSIFFHRNCTGSVKARSDILGGMVEAFPYICSVKDGGPTIYLNLRGNAFNYKSQMHYILTISNISMILFESKDLDKVKQIISTNSASHNNAVKLLLLTDVSGDEIDEDSISMFCEVEKILNAYVIPIKNLCVPDIVTEVTKFVYKTNDSILPENCFAKAREFGMNIDEDEMTNELDDARKVTDIVTKKFEHRNENALFPVQGTYYLKYASADKEFYKLKHIRTTDTVKGYRENIEKNRFLCRESQYTLTLKESLVSHFTERYERTGFHLFLRYLKLHFEQLTRVGVFRLLGEYKNLFTTMRMSECETQMDSLNDKLKELDEKMNSSALLISDFVREMAQIFESRTWFENREQREVPATVSAEVRCAVHILLEGYPIELMDGRSNSVPLEWIKSVLTELKHVVGKSIRLKVISVLGVESSGKSTLLNIMFGCLFPVGSGRCTRGIYMYLLKVNPDKTNLDYVLVLDTEGLFSSAINLDDAGTRDQQERELATFVIGLSNITLVNVMGEDIHYLKDILPISVYAFLRMDLVGLNPKCKLLHHNVDSNRKQALGWQAKAFENVLDYYTKEACSLEKVKCRQFKDVISFDPANDVYYFPSFLEANARETDFQDTVSSFYCQEVVKLKRNLLLDDSSLNLDELIHNIDRLWNAVKRENFVFEFRNMLEAEARTILDNKLCDFHWRIRTDIQVKTISFQERICKSSSTVDDLPALSEEIKADLEQYAKSKQEQLALAFGRFYDEYDTVLAKVLQKLWNDCRHNLQKITCECINESLSTIDRDIQLREREIIFKQGDLRTMHCIEQYVEKHVIPENKNFNPEKCFEDWAVSELQTDSIMTRKQIEEDAIECLYVIYSSNRTAVDSIKPLLSYDLETFCPDKDQWPKEYDIPKEEDAAAYQLVNDIKCYCVKVMDNIWCRKRSYKRTFFREVALFVKNERERLDRRLNASQKFDLELTAAACSYLIKLLVTFDTEKGLLSFNMMSTIKSFFVAKCLERKGGVTKTDYIVTGCCSSIENSIAEHLIGLQSSKTISGLTVRIITYMMGQYSFFHSKLGLLCFVWKRLLLENDRYQLLHYLKHPLAVIRSTISDLFATDISGIETDKPADAVLLEKIIRPLVSDQISQICLSLTSESTTELEEPFDRIDKVLKYLVQKLEPYLDITDIYKYEHCRVEITNAHVFLQMIIQKLQSDVFYQCLVSRIHYTFLEKNMVHDDIRLQVVNSIYLNVIGCEETCTFCGVLCCSSQTCHAEAHSALIHMPIGFKDLFGDSTPISTATCFDELERNNIFENESGTIKWTTPSNESDEGNNFWKYMFATHVCEMARKMGKIPPEVIPESWSRLTQYEVLHWLEKQIEGQQDFKSISAC